MPLPRDWRAELKLVVDLMRDLSRLVGPRRSGLRISARVSTAGDHAAVRRRRGAEHECGARPRRVDISVRARADDGLALEPLGPWGVEPAAAAGTSTVA